MRDFGGIVERTPSRIVRPETIAGVAEAVRTARTSGETLVARGQGHTTRGQSLTDGVLVELRGLRHVDIDPTARTARVGAGLLWSELLTHALAVELMPPVLTDYLGLSIGGTLSVGGIGGQSFRYGAQTDQVLSLVVVTGDGEIVECSFDRHRALFDACRAGLGRYGTIVEVVLRLVPAPRTVRVDIHTYADLRMLLAAQQLYVDSGEYDYLLGSMLPGARGWHYQLEAVRYGAGDMPFERHARRLDALVLQMQADDAWTSLHPWMDVFIPASVAADVIGEALAILDPVELADGHVMTYPLAARSTTPLLALPAGERSFLFDVLPNLRERAALPGFEARCRRILERVRAVGGGVYPIGFPIGTADQRAGDLRTPS